MAPKRLRAPRMVDPGNDGIPQHAADAPPFWESPEFRTAFQGILIDVAVALALLVYQATSAEAVDWRLLALSLARTAVQTVASGIMKRLRPREGPDNVTSMKGYRLRKARRRDDRAA